MTDRFWTGVLGGIVGLCLMVVVFGCISHVFAQSPHDIGSRRTVWLPDVWTQEQIFQLREFERKRIQNEQLIMESIRFVRDSLAGL